MLSSYMARQSTGIIWPMHCINQSCHCRGALYLIMVDAHFSWLLKISADSFIFVNGSMPFTFHEQANRPQVRQEPDRHKHGHSAKDKHIHNVLSFSVYDLCLLCLLLDALSPCALQSQFIPCEVYFCSVHCLVSTMEHKGWTTLRNHQTRR